MARGVSASAMGCEAPEIGDLLNSLEATPRFGHVVHYERLRDRRRRRRCGVVHVCSRGSVTLVPGFRFQNETANRNYFPSFLPG